MESRIVTKVMGPSLSSWTVRRWTIEKYVSFLELFGLCCVIPQSTTEWQTRMQMSSIFYLSLGSNVGDRENNLREAIQRLESVGRVVSVSSFYETEPVEVTDQEWFLNCAVALETEMKPEQLMKASLQIEREMGRRRTQNKGPRNIDLDILLFGDLVVDAPELSIPHPGMHERRFVLEPLAEIAPEAWHPVLKKSARELLEELPAGQAVRRVISKPTPNA
jgi:2-amino-4-hydroxy-6-hydroxymethyldihydropteridine diphosphokinase